MRSTGPPSTVAIRRVLDARDVRVVFQPVVDLRTQQIFAYESLVRSKSPDFDSPLSLFAAAVDSSCTGELGRMIREMSIEHCPDYPLFLNVHPAELNEKWIVQTNDPIFEHGHDVYLEITEHVPLTHFELCRSILSEVRGRGVYLVVDDLGAGYSNLKYIADLHPRIVKLDRELIAGLMMSSRLFRLVKGIVEMCGDLGAAVVAEGIETVDELEAVQETGARFGQGYLLARPAFPPPEVQWPAEERVDKRPAGRASTNPVRGGTNPGRPSTPTPNSERSGAVRSPLRSDQSGAMRAASHSDHSGSVRVPIHSERSGPLRASTSSDHDRDVPPSGDRKRRPR